MSRAFLLSGAQGLLSSWRRPARGGVSVSALAVAASRRGASQLLHRSGRDRDSAIRERWQCAYRVVDSRAVETVATLYSSALSSCEISGPSSVTRALDATWRAATASELIRRGQCVYIIGADPVDGLHLARSHWDVIRGGPRPSSWYYRVELSGPSGTAWETHSAAEVLHMRWLTDPARPWAGVSPLQHASDTGTLAAWIDKRLGEEASGPVGAFLPVARYEPAPDADLDADDADDPLAHVAEGYRRRARANAR